MRHTFFQCTVHNAQCTIFNVQHLMRNSQCMVRYIVTLLIMVVFTTANARPAASDSIDEARMMKLAYQYRYGVMREVNPSKSAAIYMQLAKRGNVKAMNQLGLMHLNGDGVDKDFGRARHLFSIAAKGGDNDAKCNLALMYQKGMGVPVDNRKALALYMSAANAGSARGYYGAGYHFYKGLGVSQDYAKAVGLLEKGAEKGHSGCDLLLGSYYANSYDGNGDTEKAERHYRRASRRGNSWTVDVTKLGVLDSIHRRKQHHGRWKHVRNKTIPEKGMRHVDGTAVSDDIAGRWTGTAYAYDWSRTEILSEEDITLDVEAMGDSVRVSWYSGDSLCTWGTMVKQDGMFVLDHADSEQRDLPWLLTAAKFDRSGNEMFAALRTFCMDTKEKRLPMFAVLERDGATASGNRQQTFTILGTSVSNGAVTISVNAAADMEVDIDLCSITGTPIHKLGTRTLSAGDNKIELSALSLTKGFFSVVLSHKGERHSKTVTVREP